MKESISPEKGSEENIKVLNKEKILEFKKNVSSGLDEAEIILENNSGETFISKIYINNYKYFKCSPNITIINKNSTKKIKVIIDDKNYKITDYDIFLIISHPVQEDNNLQNLEPKKLDEFFKNNSFKEKGQKLYLVGYKNEEKKIEKKSEDDELMNKIKELEKQVYEPKDNNDTYTSKNYQEIKSMINKNKSSINYFYIGLLVLGGAFIMYKLFKKSNK